MKKSIGNGCIEEGEDTLLPFGDLIRSEFALGRKYEETEENINNHIMLS